MDGGIHVLPHQAFIEQYGVFVVVALPGHKADQGVFAQGDLAVGSRRAVGDDVALFHPVAQVDDGFLVDASALIGAQEFDQPVGLFAQGVILDGHFPCGDPCDCAVVQGQGHGARVHGGFVFNASGHKGSFRLQQGHGLALHVGTHQGPVGVVVFQEGDHRSGHRYHHLGRYVHQVHLFPLDLDDLVPVAAGDAVRLDAAFFVQGLVGLGHDVFIFNVRRHILYFIGDDAGLFIHDAVRRLDEAVIVDAGIAGQVGDQADVGTFRRLDGAQAAIVAVMDVAHFEAGTVPGKAAGAQGRHTALVGQLSQRVVLVHELGQGRRAEELFDGGSHRPDVDQALGGDDVQILNGHALPDDPFHAGKTNAELVLQQLAHAAQAAVAQVVDVIGCAHAVGQAVQVVDGCQDVIHDDVFGDQLIHAGADRFQQVVAGVLFHQLAQHGKTHPLIDAQLFFIAVHKIVEPDHIVGEDFDFSSVHIQIGHGDALLFHLGGLFPGQHFAGAGQHFAGQRVGHRAAQLLAAQPFGDGHLLVEFITAHCGEVVAFGVKKQVVQQRLGTVHCGGLAGTQALVDLDQRILAGLDGRVFIQRGHDALIFAEQLFDLCVGADADGADQGSDGQFAVFIDAHIEDVVGIGLVFQPSAPVRDDGAGIHGLIRPLVADAVVHARGADDLRDHDAFCAVDDESAAVGHHGEIAHEDLLLFDLAGLLVAQAHAHLDGGGIGRVSLLALFHRVFRFLFHGIVQESQFQVAGIVGDGAHVAEHFPQAHIQEPLVGTLLHLDEVGHLEHLFCPREADALFFTALDCAVLLPVFHLPHSVSCQYAIHKGALHYFITFLLPSSTGFATMDAVL